VWLDVTAAVGDEDLSEVSPVRVSGPAIVRLTLMNRTGLAGGYFGRVAASGRRVWLESKRAAPAHSCVAGSAEALNQYRVRGKTTGASSVNAATIRAAGKASTVSS
jgi:hypothetical protein